MTIIGDLFIAVRPETAGFSKELDTKLKAVTSSASGALGPLSAVGAGIVGVAAAASVASIKLASDFQGAVTSIAANADIPVAAADKIGKAFLSTAGSTIFSGIQLGNAYAGVAAQLGQMNGKALGAKQALDFMKVSSDLAEGSNTDLGTATKTLTGIMQGFQIPVKDASKTADELFSTSRLTGVGLDQLGSTVERLKARLGVAAPSLSDMGALLVDLRDHGVAGSRGLLVVNSAINTLLKTATGTPEAIAKTVDSATKAASASSDALSKAQAKLAETQASLGNTGPTVAQQQALANAQDAVTQAQQRLNAATTPSLAQQQAVANATRNLTELQARQAATSGVSASGQARLASAQQAVADATAKNTTAQQALVAANQGLAPSLAKNIAGAEQLGLHVFNAAGKFVGMRDVIAQLEPKLKGLTQAQQLQALSAVFGSSANKALLATVLGGASAFDKAQAAVTKQGAAHAAAEKQAGTLKHQMETLKATASDLGVQFGTKLIPIVVDIGRDLAKVTGFFERNKAAAIALGAVVGGIATISVAAFAITLKDKLVGAIVKVGTSFGIFGRDTKEAVDRASGAYQDSAGRWHAASGKFISASDAVKLSLGEQVSAVEQLDTAIGQLANSLIELSAATDPVEGALVGLNDKERVAALVNAELANSTQAVTTAWTEMDVAAAEISAALAELDVAAEEAGVTFEALATTVETSSEGMAVVAETTGPAIEAGLGPIGIAIAAIGFLLPLLLTHWKQVWGAIKDVVNVVWHAIESALHGIMKVFDTVVGFIQSHWKIIASVLLLALGPLGLVIAGFLNFHKQIAKIVADVIGFFERLGHTVVAKLKELPGLVERVGKDIATGLLKGLEFVSPLYWVLHFRTQIVGFFKDAGKWLLKEGKSLVEGLIKGAVEAPLNAIKGIGGKILGGFKSALSIFSPSKATQEMGHHLIDGLEVGIKESVASTSKFTAGLSKLIPAFKAMTNELRKALSAGLGNGQASTAAFAKGVQDGLFKGLAPAEAGLRKFGKVFQEQIDKPLRDSASAVVRFASVFRTAFKVLQEVEVQAAAFGPRLGQQITTSLRIVGVAAAQFGPTFTKAFTGLDNILTKVRTFGQSLQREVESPIHKAVLGVRAFGPALESNIERPVLKLVASVQTFAKSFGDHFLKPIDAVPVHIKLFGDRIAWAIVGLKLADDATAKFGPNFTRHISGAFLSVATATEKFQPKFLKSIEAIGNSVGLVTKSLRTVESDVKACLTKLEADAYTAGKGLMAKLAKGITDGAAAVTSAAGAIHLTVGKPPAGAGAGGAAHKAEVDALKALLDQTRLGAVNIISSERATGNLLADLMRQSTLELTVRLADLESLSRTMWVEDKRADADQSAHLQAQLSVERLHFQEARSQTAILRQMLAVAQKPPPVTVSPTSTTSPTSSGSASQFAAAVIP